MTVTDNEYEREKVTQHTWAWDDDEHECSCESMITLCQMIMRMSHAMNDKASDRYRDKYDVPYGSMSTDTYYCSINNHISFNW